MESNVIPIAYKELKKIESSLEFSFEMKLKCNLSDILGVLTTLVHNCER
jgi:hypothetical protein